MEDAPVLLPWRKQRLRCSNPNPVQTQREVNAPFPRCSEIWPDNLMQRTRAQDKV